jgi:acyl-CoA thioester hydrolase
MTELRYEDFPARTYDKLRYGDTDRQGHVNNAVFATLFETGRVSVFHDPAAPLLKPGFSFVIARIAIDYRAEIFWPGTVEIGTGVKAVGRSSVTFLQALFQAQKCVALAESVVVQVDAATRKSAPLDEEAKARLLGMMVGVSHV